jgi:hypothetical protein
LLRHHHASLDALEFNPRLSAISSRSPTLFDFDPRSLFFDSSRTYWTAQHHATRSERTERKASMFSNRVAVLKLLAVGRVLVARAYRGRTFLKVDHALFDRFSAALDKVTSQQPAGMRERAELIGAHLSIQSLAGQGTTVELILAHPRPMA